MQQWLKKLMLAFFCLAVATILSVTEVQAIPTVVFSTDFNSGVPGEFSGVTSTTGVGSLPAPFNGRLLRNSSVGNPAAATTLTLTGLAAHDSIDLNFLLAIIDSWDGNNTFWGKDYFNVAVDGTTIFSETFTIFSSGTQSYSPPVGVELVGLGSGNFIGSSGWADTAYNMGLDHLFDGITHTATTLTVDWWASSNGGTVGWQGGSDEAWGIDNVEVVLNSSVSVPEPSTMLLLGSGLAGLGFVRRRFKA